MSPGKVRNAGWGVSAVPGRWTSLSLSLLSCSVGHISPWRCFISWRLMEVDHPLLPPGAPALPGLQRIPWWRAAANPGDVGPPGIWDTRVPRDELCRLPPSRGAAKPCRSPIPQFQSQSNTTSSALAQHTGRAASLPCRDGFPPPGSVTHPVEQHYPARIKHGVWECCALCWRASGRSRNERDTEHGAMWGLAWGKDQHLLAGILGSFHSHMAS